MKEANKHPKKYSLMARSAITILILILPFNVIGIVASTVIYQESIDSAKNVISYTLDSYATLLTNQMYNTDIMLYDLTNEPLLLSMCNLEDYDYLIAKRQLFNSMTNQIRISNAADAVFLYLGQKDEYMQFPGFTAQTAGTRPYYPYVENFEYAYSQWFLSQDKTDLVRVLYDQNMDVHFGASIDLTDFLSQLEGIDGYESMVFSFQPEEPQAAGRTEIIFQNRISDGVYFTASMSKKEINNSLTILQYMLILFFIISLALVPLLIFLMKKYVGLPLSVLNRAHSQLKEGNEDYRIGKSADSAEFDAAYKSFNAMAASIQELHHEVMDKELSNKQLQIDYLQLQIRPHFLLNSFNVLYTLIQQNQKEPSQEMVLFLSNYFRYLFRSGHELQPFSKERILIENYMDIVKIYYPSSFEVSYQIDPILDLMRVPPLLLHSFMENIIAHALLPDRQIHIVFSGEYDDGLATFYISDDGKGMEPQALFSINHLDEHPIDDGKNVGIKNSIRRLKYYYGEEASVTCDSELHVGTTFTIAIPYNLEEN